MKAASLSGLLLAQALCAAPLVAQTPAPPAAPTAKPAPAPPGGVKPIPPPGVQVPDDVKNELTAGVAALAKEIELLRKELAGKPQLLAELPNVEIFHKAADWALRYDEFFDAKQFDVARQQLQQGMARAALLRKGETPWNAATGLVLRAYRSKIDGSVQPYGLVIPSQWSAADKTPRRLDFWLHGRGEKLSELSFIDDRQKNKGEFTPEGAIVLHLYGRYCCANKFAGETDLFEALEDARRHYPIDMNRLVVRGFSMGGASTWQFATHHAGVWAAAAPGAGFAETAEFFHSFAAGKEPPPWYEQVLWRWYDSTIYAKNLVNYPIVAYSGEIDGQKQAADIMSRYMEKEGLTLPHIIGPQTAHKYHPEAKPKIEEFVTAAATKGRDPNPQKVHLTTYTLIYPQMRWVRVLGMQKEWERADVDAEIQGSKMTVKTSNVSGLSVTLPRIDAVRITEVSIDGTTLPMTGRMETGVAFHKGAKGWEAGAPAAGKSPEVCGPIDHAFMSSFVMVRPTGKPLNDAVGAWTKSEMDHAAKFWRQVYRGDAPIKDDRAITDADIQNSNLVLWGDPSSNAVLAKILAKLPIQWTAQTITTGKDKYDATRCAPVLIFPNPLNPKRYVVINSGVTYREQALLNNSDQTPKLPDWAVVDVKTPAGPRWPGEILNAGFFDESWRFQ